MANIFDVAKLSGYSKSTVSRVINNNGAVSKEAEEKIKDAMEKLNYTPSYFAQGMRTNKTNTIAVLIPDFTNPFYPELVENLEIFARKNGYMITICNTHENPEKELSYIKEIVKKNIDGIIFCTYNRVKNNINYLLNISEDIPVVFMDEVFNGTNLHSYVITDGLNGTKKAISYLINKGRKNIGYIKGSSENRVTKERFEGYKQGLLENNIKFNPDLVYTGNFHMKSGFKGAKKILNKTKDVDAIMAATDVMAIGAMKYLKYNNILIPEEINVVGFDNISISVLVEPSLTTVAQPIKELSEKAITILSNNIDNDEQEQKQIKLKGELIIRGSTDKDSESLDLGVYKDKIVY